MTPSSPKPSAPPSTSNPGFVLADQEQRATARLNGYRGASGKRPNVLVILFDDVGWGDFGCYGGGVAVGAPTPNIDGSRAEGCC